MNAAMYYRSDAVNKLGSNFLSIDRLGTTEQSVLNNS